MDPEYNQFRMPDISQNMSQLPFLVDRSEDEMIKNSDSATSCPPPIKAPFNLATAAD
jgi:hypothetical protein